MAAPWRPLCAWLTFCFAFVFARPAAGFGCRNRQGSVVDWWVMYKEDNGCRYMYYDSKLAAQDAQSTPATPSSVQPLANAHLVHGTDSPLLQTMAQAEGAGDAEQAHVFAWNDQTATSCSSTDAHAKGVFGMKLERGTEDAGRGVVKSFLIQHTLPRFPARGCSSAAPYDKTLFADNLGSCAQHFFCMSFQDDVSLAPAQVQVQMQMQDAPAPTRSTRPRAGSQTQRDPRTEIVFNEELVEGANFFRMLWLYVYHVKARFIWQPSDLGAFGSALRAIPSRRSTVKANTVPSLHMHFPSGPVLPFPDRLSSFAVHTTNHNQGGGLSVRVLAKYCPPATGSSSPTLNRVPEPGSNQCLDLYDDVTALLAIGHEEYLCEALPLAAAQSPERRVHVLMVAQSYMDRSTLRVNQRELCRTARLHATVHVANSLYCHLPDEDLAPGDAQITGMFGRWRGRVVVSPYKDHSKWSVNVLYGHTGNFPPLLCFYDLNRSQHQARRSGAALCLNSSLSHVTASSRLLWQVFMGLRPEATALGRFNDAPLRLVLRQLLPPALAPPALASSGWPSTVSPPSAAVEKAVCLGRARRMLQPPQPFFYNISHFEPTNRSAIVQEAEQYCGSFPVAIPYSAIVEGAPDEVRQAEELARHLRGFDPSVVWAALSQAGLAMPGTTPGTSQSALAPSSTMKAANPGTDARLGPSTGPQKRRESGAGTPLKRTCTAHSASPGAGGRHASLEDVAETFPGSVLIACPEEQGCYLSLQPDGMRPLMGTGYRQPRNAPGDDPSAVSLDKLHVLPRPVSNEEEGCQMVWPLEVESAGEVGGYEHLFSLPYLTDPLVNGEG